MDIPENSSGVRDLSRLQFCDDCDKRTWHKDLFDAPKEEKFECAICKSKREYESLKNPRGLPQSVMDNEYQYRFGSSIVKRKKKKE